MDRGPAAACAITPEIALRFRWWGAGGEPARIDATQRKLPQLIRLPYQGDVHKHAAPCAPGGQRCGEGAAAGGGGESAPAGARATAELVQVRGHLLELVETARRQQQIRPSQAELQRECPADAERRPRDQHGATADGTVQRAQVGRTAGSQQTGQQRVGASCFDGAPRPVTRLRA